MEWGVGGGRIFGSETTLPTFRLVLKGVEAVGMFSGLTEVEDAGELGWSNAVVPVGFVVAILSTLSARPSAQPDVVLRRLSYRSWLSGNTGTQAARTSAAAVAAVMCAADVVAVADVVTKAGGPAVGNAVGDSFPETSTPEQRRDEYRRLEA
jgi:hypothetical protein